MLCKIITQVPYHKNKNDNYCYLFIHSLHEIPYNILRYREGNDQIYPLYFMADKIPGVLNSLVGGYMGLREEHSLVLPREIAAARACKAKAFVIKYAKMLF